MFHFFLQKKWSGFWLARVALGAKQLGEAHRTRREERKDQVLIGDRYILVPNFFAKQKIA